MSDAPHDLASRRKDYETAGLDLPDVLPDPMAQWRRWYSEASEAGCVEPNAFVLGTIGEDGFPQSRYLLVRGADAAGFSFFTNYESAKSREMAAEPRASMLFTWLQLHRQVRVVGEVHRVDDAESDEYFASRPRGSQLGAWSSPQSHPIPDRDWLEGRVEQMASTFVDADVPRPAFWGGWRLIPRRFEFWQGRPSRLHDRLAYHLLGAGEGDSWQITRLAP
jgi:pyridoxamine 5'-phosphate oxidase